ncbi:LOW QUALITY PROTEIN: hypothetical protein HID58_071029 [Brassica napus]|uniref:RNase H type-1 domain-containing protein n=1 Tax=Brassica napus TaxID=3708 RepID=A0ABQ7Z0L2_BRANA|nr:LOW QUALITY PROTEIN: hypothetical protein HID58_071029 [Brassica napus]
MAMMYISHSDATKRLARIQRVRQGIADNQAESSLRLTKITKELDKGNGHVYSYKEQYSRDDSLNYGGLVIRRKIDDGSDGETKSSASKISVHSSPVVHSGFQLGPSSEGRVLRKPGNNGSQRKRPSSWKRKSLGQRSVEAGLASVEVQDHNGWVKCRLDRSFGNSDWFALFPRSNLEYLELWASDHRPIRVCFALERDSPTKSRFQFDKRMLSREGFEDLVRLSWEGKYGESVKKMDHIRRCHRNVLPDFTSSNPLNQVTSPTWVKPSGYFLKCNVGSSWSQYSGTCGASWLLRDFKGNVLLHSRRAFSGVLSSVQADFLALSWSAAAMSDLKMKKIIFEFSSIQAGLALEHPLAHPASYYSCHQDYKFYSRKQPPSVPITCNSPAIQIATSVTRDHRYHSYVARLGPNWLAASLSKEAS